MFSFCVFCGYDSVHAMSGEFIYCTKCGMKNAENNYQCEQCGFVLHDAPAPAVVTDDNSIGGIIPHKNIAALTAYYLGVFAIVPFLGIPLGIAAIILGIRGVQYERKHPEFRGRYHALAGIILGIVFTLGYTLLAITFIIAIPV